MDDQKNPRTPEKVEEGPSNNMADNEEQKSRSFKRGVWQIFQNYLERCTMTGIPFIMNSKHKTVKTAWSLLLFFAFCLMVAHLVALFATYYEYKTHSQVVYTLSALEFPAVTFCNVNPVRKSQQGKTQNKLFFEFIDDIEENLTNHLPLLFYGNNSASASKPPPEEIVTIFDTFFNNAEREIYRAETKDNESDASLDASMKGKSSWGRILTLFHKMFSNLSNEVRFQIGHQLSDMVVDCYFNGYSCDTSCFTKSLSLTFGNCFTMSCSNFISSESGPEKGLTLILSMEMYEYMPFVSESKGAVVVVHDKNKVPFPEEDGIALQAGWENMVGIRRVDVKRLTEPYGKCTPLDPTEENFKFTTTRTTCIKVCRLEHIWRECGCHTNMYPQIGDMLNVSNNERHCMLGVDDKCIERAESTFRVHGCHCRNPCTETKYDEMLSTREWPSPGFMDLLLNSICLKSPVACEHLAERSNLQLRDEFLKVNIYFEDLNHEIYSEVPDYEITQFLSDVGGTIGLWIGLSILGVFEVVHLVIDLSFYLCRSLFYSIRRRRQYGHSQLITV